MSELTEAARSGQARRLKRLLAAWADLDRAVEGSRALRWAAREGHEPCVKALLDAGADPDALDALSLPDEPLALLRAATARDAPALVAGVAAGAIEVQARAPGEVAPRTLTRAEAGLRLDDAGRRGAVPGRGRGAGRGAVPPRVAAQGRPACPSCAQRENRA